MRFPVYVISKGRADAQITSGELGALGVAHSLVVEPQEAEGYRARAHELAKVLVLPFSNLGQGSIPARNWVWEHATTAGAERHWIMDDNIQGFYRYNRNRIAKLKTPAGLEAVEDFVDRYENVPMAGLNYEMFVPRAKKLPPFVANRRVYSCILLSNAEHDRIMWRGRYNEDTDLSLRFLKRGDCTILVNAFLAKKIATMRMKGGNTDELYKQNEGFDGRLEMARSLQRQHPDVTKVTWKWGRWQHQVDYRPFRGNKLIRRPGVEPSGVNNYGMSLRRPL